MKYRWPGLNSLLLATGISLTVPATSHAQAMPQQSEQWHKHDMSGQSMEGMSFGHGGMGHKGPMSFLRGADLTEAQHDKIFTIMHTQAPQMREYSKLARKSHQELRALATSGKYDEAQAKALADAGARAMAGMALLHARSESQIYALLTPEQRAKIEEMKAKFKSGHHAMRG